MTYSLSSLWDITEICTQKGLRHTVLSPGSRCAPLVHGFTNHPKMKCFTITDERSAGFIAMGIAQQIRKPVVLVCTSGTAGINYFSAVAEAFYQDVPLLILTADRPPELLDQQDGQTIQQREIYGKHVRKSFQLPDDFSHPDKIWHTERIVNEAINLSLEFPPKPVHINIPIREPFYPKETTKISYKKEVKLIEKENFETVLDKSVIQKLQNKLQKFEKIVVIAGQDFQNIKLCELLSDLEIPVISDIISNTHSISNRIQHQDFILLNDHFREKIGQPDLLITFGKSVISKNLKLAFRKYPPHEHWHIQKDGYVADTFQSLTKVIPTSEWYFFKNVFIRETTSEIKVKRKNYLKIWTNQETKFKTLFPDLFEKFKFSESEIIYETLRQLPTNSNLHLANSMTVRYANVFNFLNRSKPIENIEVFANRGTSGIDGSTSTAVGHSLVSDKLNILITGDLAFFYDRNAFWNRYKLVNLRIVLLNNHGGGIFTMIPGPNVIEKSTAYFLTPQPHQARLLCKDFGIDYQIAKTKTEFFDKLEGLFLPSNSPKLLECETSFEDNQIIWKALKIKAQSFN